MYGRFGLWFWCRDCKTDEYISPVRHSKNGYNYYCRKCGALINGIRLTEKRIRADILGYVKEYGAGGGIPPQVISLELGIPFENVMRVMQELIDKKIIETKNMMPVKEVKINSCECGCSRVDWHISGIVCEAWCACCGRRLAVFEYVG